MIKNKIIVSGIILFLIISSGCSVLGNNLAIEEQDSSEGKIKFSKAFSEPKIIKNDNFIKIDIKEANEIKAIDNNPKIPFFTKTFELPFNSNIKNINTSISNVFEKDLSQVLTKNHFQKLTTMKDSNLIEIKNEKKISNTEFDWYEINKGTGLNKENRHVLFISLDVYPVHILSEENKLEYIKDIKIEIDYDEPSFKSEKENSVDLLIISPKEFKPDLVKLVNHKNNYNIKTNLTTLDYIYENYQGRDAQEKIKFYIKEKLDNLSIKYVLLVGSIKKLPIRSTDAYPWRGFGSNILSDLYYADIYDENFSFCTWDSNDNDVFGEADYEYKTFPPKVYNYDNVDLYPDVHIGRIACRNNKEVKTMVNKIINYEKNTYDQLWFKKIILAGGDTFPPGKLAPFNVFEGEITNEKVSQQLPDFEPIKLWSSKRNLNAFTFNRAINRGAGFLTYAGHGFEHGWGTYRANALRSKMGITNPLYYTPFLQGLKNNDKLPIVFFDACLTAKLDFNMTSLKNYYPKMANIIRLLTGFDHNPDNYFPCFAWSMVSKEGGGSIAAIGSTRPAYTLVDEDGVYMGAGYLDVHFFKSYYEGITVGEMLTHSQIDYLNNKGEDIFTLEEFILLGDPSLRVGGFP